MVAIGTNFFYTVTLPVTLWFLNKGKRGTDRADTVLFIDALHLYRQIDRAHRDFLPEHIELLANIVRLYRGEQVETVAGSDTLLKERFPNSTYVDVPGLCRVATLAEIEAQGWSLNDRPERKHAPRSTLSCTAHRQGRIPVAVHDRRTTRGIERRSACRCQT
jgi:type I restriction enzyme M protein